MYFQKQYQMISLKFKLAIDPLHLINFICEQQLAPSKKEARRLLDQGAISINDQRISNPAHEFTPKNNTIIRVGKRKFLKIITQ